MPRPQDSGPVERSILNWIRLYIARFFYTTNSQIRRLPSLRSRRLEVTGARKNGARERDTRGEWEHPVACLPRILSCTHFFQAPSSKASESHPKIPKKKHTHSAYGERFPKYFVLVSVFVFVFMGQSYLVCVCVFFSVKFFPIFMGILLSTKMYCCKLF